MRAVGMSKEPLLFADVECADASQGHLGDCWLISAIAGLAEFKGFLKQLFITKEIVEEGKYQVRLYDPELEDWRVIEIDDYLPCKSSYKDELLPCFAHVPDGLMTVALLEKAFAKMFGTYLALESNKMTRAWYHMTGCNRIAWIKGYYEAPVHWCVTSYAPVRQANQRSSRRIGVLAKGATFVELERVGPCVSCLVKRFWILKAEIKYKKIDGEGPEEGFLFYYFKGRRVAERMTEVTWKCTDEGDLSEIPEDELFQRLKSYEESNFLLGVAQNSPQDEEKSGLVSRHAFNLLRLVEVDKLRLVSCRNPYGNFFEWKGPWADGSEEWEENPKVAEVLEVDFQTDGVLAIACYSS